jgi:hypothetical protein
LLDGFGCTIFKISATDGFAPVLERKIVSSSFVANHV